VIPGANRPLLQTVEDQLEAPRELRGVVVTGLGEPLGDLREVRVVVEPADRLAVWMITKGFRSSPVVERPAHNIRRGVAIAAS